MKNQKATAATPATGSKSQKQFQQKYRSRPDPITNPIERERREKHNRMHHALAGFDRKMAEVERVWGVDRLPTLVPPVLAERFGSAMAKLDDAIDADDPETVAKKAAVVMRGLDALQAWARENGVTPEPEQPVIATASDGKRIAIAADMGAAELWRKKGSLGCEVFSLEEVANIVLSHTTALVSRVKDEFPGAKITAVDTQTDFDFKRGDDVPF